MWPADDHWSTEIDILEMPGAEKKVADATMHWDRTGEYKELWLNQDRDHAKAHSSAAVDLSVWRTFDCRRTYRTVNGDVLATIRVWIDGVEMTQPARWVDNSFLDQRMVFWRGELCLRSSSRGLVFGARLQHAVQQLH